ESIDLNDAVALLSQGSNYLAVEVHHAAPDDTTLLWDADLTYSQTPVLTRGPYLQVATPTSITVRWRTNFATDSKVRYGSSVGSLGTASSDGVLTTNHVVTVSGLAPDTRYYYSVETSTTKLEGDDASHTFLTPPA